MPDARVMAQEAESEVPGPREKDVDAWDKAHKYYPPIIVMAAPRTVPGSESLQAVRGPQ